MLNCIKLPYINNGNSMAGNIKTFMIPDELWEEFKKKCSEDTVSGSTEKVTASKVLRYLIEFYIKSGYSIDFYIKPNDIASELISDSLDIEHEISDRNEIASLKKRVLELEKKLCK